MTDKVIIDGIDANKCMYLEYGMCKATRDAFGDYTAACTDYDIQDCYYRQLKRKEQECEQYKKEINRLNKIGYCCAYEKGCHEICKQQNCIIKNGYKYKQALDEIEKLADIREVHGLTDTQYVDNFRFHQERILSTINKTKENNV